MLKIQFALPVLIYTGTIGSENPSIKPFFCRLIVLYNKAFCPSSLRPKNLGEL
jgi:hypothetical protein